MSFPAKAFRSLPRFGNDIFFCDNVCCFDKFLSKRTDLTGFANRVWRQKASSLQPSLGPRKSSLASQLSIEGAEVSGMVVTGE